jgi:hypothetical protein
MELSSNYFKFGTNNSGTDYFINATGNSSAGRIGGWAFNSYGMHNNLDDPTSNPESEL